MKNRNAQALIPATMPQKLAWLKELHRDPDLTYGQKAVAFALFTFHNQDSGRCNPSHEQIGETVGGMKRPAVSAALRALKAKGWVSWIRTRGHSYYQLSIELAVSQVPAEMSGSNDNSPEASGMRCPENLTSDVRKIGHQMSEKSDMEPSTLTVHIEPSFPASSAKAAGTKDRASGQIGDRETRPDRSRRSELPEGWQPDDNCRTLALDAGVRESDLADVISEFVTHHRGRGTIAVDWPVMWQGWCRKAVEIRTARQGRLSLKTAAAVEKCPFTGRIKHKSDGIPPGANPRYYIQ